eukprot:9221522-Alexandrium_andersonii.AAC.1
MDQRQVQWCAFDYLTFGPPSLNAVALMDPHHIRSNDLWEALRNSGMQSDMINSTLCHNISYGPWQSGKRQR